MENELVQLTYKIRKPERVLDVMYDRATGLEKRLQGGKETPPGTSTLPVELLGMIFKEVIMLSGVGIDYKPSSLESETQVWPVIRPELLISHVSTYWRAVAIATPSFWTHICLHVKQSADLVNLYLSRSRGLPLDLAFRQHFVRGIHPRQSHPADYPRIAATILDHMHVCRRLEVRTNVPVPELLDGLSRTRAPLLQELVLSHPCSGMRELIFSSSSFPRLIRLELVELLSVSITMPIKTLTSLTLVALPAFRLPASSFLSLLSGLQSLYRLELLDEVVDFDHSHITGVVKMPSLRSLMIKPGFDVSRIYLTRLMETVITPALEEFILDFTNLASPREIQLFLRHLKREAPRFLSVRHVTINSPFEGFDIASTLVHAAPNVESLCLSRYSVDSVLMCLAHDARCNAFPELLTLQFENPHFDWDVVLSFLQKRKEFGRPLRSLKFGGFGGSRGKVLDGLFRKLLEACLAV